MCNVASRIEVSAEEDLPELAAMSGADPLVLSSSDIARVAQWQAWHQRMSERRRALSPHATSIPHMHNVPAEMFLDLFYAAGRPLVLPGLAADWRATQQWSSEYLVNAVGDTAITYQGGRESAPDFELDKDRHVRTMPFDAFLAMALDRDTRNDAYVTAYNSAANQRAFAPLKDDLEQVPYLDSSNGMLWIGPEDTFTPLHHDLTNNLLVQIVGHKRLELLAPSETHLLANHRAVFSEVHDIEDPACLAKFPLAEYATSITIDLGPGDALFIPAGWWHQVRSLSFSMMLTYTNFIWPNDAAIDFPSV